MRRSSLQHRNWRVSDDEHSIRERRGRGTRRRGDVAWGQRGRMAIIVVAHSLRCVRDRQASGLRSPSHPGRPHRHRRVVPCVRIRSSLFSRGVRRTPGRVLVPPPPRRPRRSLRPAIAPPARVVRSPMTAARSSSSDKVLGVGSSPLSLPAIDSQQQQPSVDLRDARTDFF